MQPMNYSIIFIQQNCNNSIFSSIVCLLSICASFIFSAAYLIILKQFSMARGGHGLSHGHTRIGSSGFRHHHHGGGYRINFGTNMDIIANAPALPTILNGTFTLQGGQINVMARLSNSVNTFTNPTMPNPNLPENTMQNMQLTTDIEIGMKPFVLNPMQNQSIVEANITIVGNKVENGSQCCLVSTIVFGACLIFPICFICCNWWKKIVSPMYDLSIEFYRLLGVFLRRESTCRMLNLTVVDNRFNAQKARVLFESLSGSSLTGFTFRNLALACNYQQAEADSFISNVTPLKSLPFPTQIVWDSMNL